LLGKSPDKNLNHSLGSFVIKRLFNHLKNNGVQYLHKMQLNVAISSSNIPNTLNSLSELPPNCGITRYLKAMEHDVKAGRMTKTIGQVDA